MFRFGKRDYHSRVHDELRRHALLEEQGTTHLVALALLRPTIEKMCVAGEGAATHATSSGEQQQQQQQQHGDSATAAAALIDEARAVQRGLRVIASATNRHRAGAASVDHTAATAGSGSGKVRLPLVRRRSSAATAAGDGDDEDREAENPDEAATIAAERDAEFAALLRFARLGDAPRGGVLVADVDGNAAAASSVVPPTYDDSVLLRALLDAL